MTVALRPYQQTAVDGIRDAFRRGCRAPLLVAPCGAGKTVMFSHIAGSASSRRKRVLIVAHRRELIKQASRKLRDADIQHGIIAPWADPTDAFVQVGSIQTVGRRLGRIEQFDLIVMDEAHHAVAGLYGKLIDAQPQALLFGVTATPERLDGRGLGVKCGGCFDEIVMGPTIAELMNLTHLTRAKVFAPAERLDLSGVPMRGGDFEARALVARVNRPQLTGDAVEHYTRHAAGLPAIAFCSSVEHAEAVAKAFRAAGWRSVCAHGGMPAGERDAALSGLATGATQVLTTCDLISEGLDVPAVGAVILLRPTKSLGLHVQQVGRGLRPAEGKSHLIVLDHAGNTFAHGLPDTVYEWSLDGRKKRDRAKVPATWQCPKCFAIQAPTKTCSECGWTKPAEERTPSSEREINPGDLAEVNQEHVDWLRRAPYNDVMRAAKSESDLREIARARGYKQGWVWHQMQVRRQQPGVPA